MLKAASGLWAVLTLRQWRVALAPPLFLWPIWPNTIINHHSPNFLGAAMRIASSASFLSPGSAALRAVILSAAGFVGMAQAQTVADNTKAEELAKEHGCLSCHAKHEKLVGPSNGSVAEKYKDDKDAVASLVQSIQRGSKGKWGRTPMPPHDTMSQADLKALATWVMSTHP